MCDFQNIRVAEGNDFTLVLPLRARSYTIDGRPSDSDLDVQHLSDVAVKIGGVAYTHTTDAAGVSVQVPGTLARGTYDVVLTGKYFDSSIRAAYFEGLTIVAWNYQSDAEQYLPGSPIVAKAVMVIGGAKTDAEVEALKEELRQKIADAEQAQADAEAAKEHYDELAEQLQGVAQQTTLVEGIASVLQGFAPLATKTQLTTVAQDILTAISHIDIDTTSLAKETTAEAAKQAALDAKTAAQAITGYALQGTDATATNTALAALIGYTIQEINGV